jgi:hypothetical protein
VRRSLRDGEIRANRVHSSSTIHFRYWHCPALPVKLICDMKSTIWSQQRKIQEEIMENSVGRRKLSIPMDMP